MSLKPSSLLNLQYQLIFRAGLDLIQNIYFRGQEKDLKDGSVNEINKDIEKNSINEKNENKSSDEEN